MLNLFERALRDSPQCGQRRVTLHRVLFQFLGDVFSAFVIAAIAQGVAGFFQNRFHVGYRPLTQFTHCATFPGA